MEIDGRARECERPRVCDGTRHRRKTRASPLRPRTQLKGGQTQQARRGCEHTHDRLQRPVGRRSRHDTAHLHQRRVPHAPCIHTADRTLHCETRRHRQPAVVAVTCGARIFREPLRPRTSSNRKFASLVVRSSDSHETAHAIPRYTAVAHPQVRGRRLALRLGRCGRS